MDDYRSLHSLFIKLPKEERKENNTLIDHLFSMDSYVFRFKAAIHLCDHAHQLSQDQETQRRIYRQWPLMAGRDGAFSIYHFGSVIPAFNSQLSKCPTLFKKAEKTKLKEANTLFKNEFSRFARIRHAVGHEATLYVSQNEREKNIKRGPYEGPSITSAAENLIVSDSFQGRNYTVTYGGEVLTYELSEATLQKLTNIKNLFWSALTEINLEHP